MVTTGSSFLIKPSPVLSQLPAPFLHFSVPILDRNGENLGKLLFCSESATGDDNED